MKAQVRLKPFTEDDFARLIAWVDSPELSLQFAGPIFHYPLDADQLSMYLKDPNRRAYKVIEEEMDSVVGHAELYRTGPNRIKLCRIIIGDASFRGKGLGTAIVLRLLDIAFQELAAEVAELNVYAWNLSAIKCYQKVGFIVQAKDDISSRSEASGNEDVVHMILKKHMWGNTYLNMSKY